MTVMALLLLLGLAGVGVGYGLWSKSLLILGTVDTGWVDARWTLATCSEFYPWPVGGHAGEVEGKDVGSTSAEIDAEDPSILHITVTNGYPSYAVDCQVHFTNSGTIPVFMRGTTIIPVSANLTNCTLTGNQAKTLSCDQLTVKFVDNIGSQFDPGDELASSLTLHVEQPADELATYEFEVQVCMAQWNEPATAAECFAAAP
jgi:hypothetical protein